MSLNLFNNQKQEITESLRTYIEDMIDKRNRAKKEKDYTLADQIRNELLKKGITLIDTREGTKFEIE